MKDRNTTIAGILTVAATLIDAAIALLQHKPVNVPTLVTGLTAGAGLIKAADSK